MPIIPFSGMVESAIRFMNQPPLWFCIGRTTPWPDENNPPNENDFSANPQYLDYLNPEELIGFKRVEVTQLCVPDVNGEVKYKTQRYKLIDTQDAVEYQARWLYIRATLDYIERNSANQSVIGLVTYRQTCLMSGIVPLDPYKDEVVLTPNQVQRYPTTDLRVPERLRGTVKGRLVYLQNHKPRERFGTMRDIFELVREFRG